MMVSYEPPSVLRRRPPRTRTLASSPSAASCPGSAPSSDACRRPACALMRARPDAASLGELRGVSLQRGHGRHDGRQRLCVPATVGADVTGAAAVGCGRRGALFQLPLRPAPHPRVPLLCLGPAGLRARPQVRALQPPHHPLGIRGVPRRRRGAERDRRRVTRHNPSLPPRPPRAGRRPRHRPLPRHDSGHRHDAIGRLADPRPLLQRHLRRGLPPRGRPRRHCEHDAARDAHDAPRLRACGAGAAAARGVARPAGRHDPGPCEHGLADARRTSHRQPGPALRPDRRAPGPTPDRRPLPTAARRPRTGPFARGTPHSRSRRSRPRRTAGEAPARTPRAARHHLRARRSGGERGPRRIVRVDHLRAVRCERSRHRRLPRADGSGATDDDGGKMPTSRRESDGPPADVRARRQPRRRLGPRRLGPRRLGPRRPRPDRRPPGRPGPSPRYCRRRQRSRPTRPAPRSRE